MAEALRQNQKRIEKGQPKRDVMSGCIRGGGGDWAEWKNSGADKKILAFLLVYGRGGVGRPSRLRIDLKFALLN